MSSVLARFRGTPAVQYVTSAIKLESYLRQEFVPKFPGRQKPLGDTILEIAMKITNSVCYANTFNPASEKDFIERAGELKTALRNLETLTTRIQVAIDINFDFQKAMKNKPQEDRDKKTWKISERQMETLAGMIDSEVALINGVLASDRKRYKATFPKTGD